LSRRPSHSPIVFDTQALLKFYLGEKGAEEVENQLKLVLEKEVKGYLNLVNLAEFYYILCRVDNNLGREKESNLRSYGIEIVPLADDESELWKRAAMVKAEHSLSLADAFAAATALYLNARLITGADKEFDGIRNLRVERL